MRFRLHRYELGLERTFGVLFDLASGWAAHTLEDAVRVGPKIPGKTAIPAGTYPVLLTMSARFGTELPLIDRVPNFSGIRIHAGNTEADTEGCLLVGLGRTADRIVESRPALTTLLTKMRATGGPHVLEVINGQAID